MNSEKRNTIRKTIKLIRKLRPHYLPVLIITKMLATIHPFVTIIISSWILDAIIEKTPYSEIMQLVVLLTGTSAALILVRWGMEKIVNVYRRELSERVQQMLGEKSLQLDYEILEKKETLELIYKAQEGMNAYGGIDQYMNLLGELIGHCTKILYAIIIFAGVMIPKAGQFTGFAKLLNQWYSGFIILAVLGVSMFGISKIQRCSNELGEEEFKENIEYNRGFSYLFQFIYRYELGKDIRIYHMQNMINEEARALEEKGEKIAWKYCFKMIRINMLDKIVNYGLQLTCYFYAGLKAILGLVSVGSVLRYISAFTQLCEGLSSITFTYNRLSFGSKYVAYFYEFMQIENKKYEGTLPIEKRDDNRYQIEFRDVSFHYPNNDTMVLEHVNMKLNMQEKMAIVGKNGAGKTTFIKLLCRLYDPTEGEILLNGINIKYYNYTEYMKLFSVVFQDFQLFSFSLAENVATSEELDEERVRKSLIRAGFEKRLKEMPNDIHTALYQLEKAGVEISGGEAQKIAIARALYKDAPFVILDEPTSALDPISEYEIYKRFDELVEAKTAIYISHRMSSSRFCDHIIVFDQGKIVQQGSHSELVGQESSIYYQMWNAQAQYYQA